MRIIPVATAFFLLAALLACGTDPTGGGPSPEKTDQITVKYPNLFLQDENGKVVCTLEEIMGPVRPVYVNDGNTTFRIDRPNINIRPDQPELYETFVEVQLQSDGLVKTDRPMQRRPYTGRQEKWEWGLMPAPGLKEGAEVRFRLVINVTRQPKTPGAHVEEIRDIWSDSTFSARVGPPASRVNAAFYASPLCALGGVFTIGVGLRRRKDAPGEELEEVEYDRSAPAARAAAAGPEEEVEEEVSSTVYAPAEAAPGDGFLVQVFVHLPEQAAAVEGLAKETDADTRRAVAEKLKKPVRRGTELAFHLQMPGLEVDEPAQTCVWEGAPARIQFGVIVPDDCKPRKLFGTVTVCENSVPVGHLKFMFKITGEAAPATAPEPVRADMTRYRQAFISYASKDRPEVLKRVQMLNLTKINFFQDLLTLEPGDEWAKKLYEYIDKSDVFFLFWSKAASESEWVKREIEYARKASEDATPGPEIVPVIIEGPPHVPPPAELSFLHFNDKFLYFINTRGGA
jgi:hypothetical protein